METYSITPQHPKEFKEFKKWHALACPTDPMNAADRWKKLGYKLPTDDDSGTKKKK